MRIPSIIAATILVLSPLQFHSVAQAQSAGEPSADEEAFEFRWDTLSNKPYEDQIQRLRNEATDHCSKMANRSIAGYPSRRGFVGACARMIEHKAMAQLAERSSAKEKGARLARRPPSK